MRSYPGRSVTSTQGRRRSDDEKINNTKNPRSNGSKIQWRKDPPEQIRDMRLNYYSAHDMRLLRRPARHIEPPRLRLQRMSHPIRDMRRSYYALLPRLLPRESS